MNVTSFALSWEILTIQEPQNVPLGTCTLEMIQIYINDAWSTCWQQCIYWKFLTVKTVTYSSGYPECLAQSMPLSSSLYIWWMIEGMNNWVKRNTNPNQSSPPQWYWHFGSHKSHSEGCLEHSRLLRASLNYTIRCQ